MYIIILCEHEQQKISMPSQLRPVIGCPSDGHKIIIIIIIAVIICYFYFVILYN